MKTHRPAGAGRVEVMTADISGGIEETAKRYTKYWHDKSMLYWYWRLFQEVFELGLALLGLHNDTVEHEVIQIASIATNMLKQVHRKNK